MIYDKQRVTDISELSMVELALLLQAIVDKLDLVVYKGLDRDEVAIEVEKWST